jgi:signal transduction histidine kinase
MKSIRVSLILYFLLLLTGALGAVSFLVYRTTSQALQAKQETNRQLVQEQFEMRRHEEAAKVDNALYAQARNLATLAQSRFHGNRFTGVRFLALGTLTNAPGPSGHITGMVWLMEGLRGPLFWHLNWSAVTQIDLDEDLLHRDEKNNAEYYMQINPEWGGVWRPKTQTGHLQAALPFDLGQLSTMSLLDWRFDNVTLEGNQHLRRVVLKAPITRYRVSMPFMPPGSGGPPPRRSGGARPVPPPGAGNGPSETAPRGPDRVTDQQSPPIYFQCAIKTDALDQTLAALHEEEAEQLRDLEDESRASLRQLRVRLMLIALATFTAICVGGSLLIGYGLMPLRRLSDAVSRVSEKDFRLQLEGPPPPREVAPIIERLQQSLELLRQAFEREKQSTADISHELRTPLAGLLTTLEVALRKPRNGDEYRQTLTDCRDLVKQMTQLVERLLALTRLDARSDRLRPEPVDAVAVAEQCAALIRPLARAKSLSVQLHHDGPVPLTTDPDKLREITSNLMHNAVEYNRRDGAIDVFVHAADDGGLDLEVRDTGIGIAPEDRERIFERFFRADPSRTADSMHAGLGLAIVRGYVELMGGSIRVESEPGRGSAFRVHIPSLEPKQPLSDTKPELVRLGA